MNINIAAFRAHEGQSVDVMALPTKTGDFFESENDYEAKLRANVERLAEWQERLYAQDTHAVLVVLQAMDTGGKDGLIRHVFSGINPQGCQVSTFGRPSETELQHDFLWRTTLRLPMRGNIGVFNRSYYEEVLVVKVHPEILDSQHLPAAIRNDPSIWRQRYEAIREYEQHLDRSGIRVVKLFLHISKEEQRKRLLARLDEPAKHWKFNLGDIEERRYWDDYMKAFSECISATSTERAPWYVIPADSKKNARLIASEILLRVMEEINPQWPEVSEEGIADLERGRVALAGARQQVS